MSWQSRRCECPQPLDGASVVLVVAERVRLACVWIPSHPLVELYRRLRGGGAGGLLACWSGAVLLLPVSSWLHIVDVRSAPSVEQHSRS